MEIDKKIKDLIFSKTPITQIIEIYQTNLFIEVLGRAGGDILAYRIYNNGSVCEI